MTKEEAKSFLIAISYDLGNMAVEYLSEKDGEKMREAIKALEQQPCEEYNYKALWEQVKWERDVATEQLEQLGYSLGEKIRTSEDCISRQALIEKATSWDKHFADSERCVSLTEIQNAPSVTPKASEQQPSREWKEIYAESEGSNSWIEFKCPHCGYSFGMESGEYDWHYGDEIPWKYCPICGGSAEHKPYKVESEE